MDPDIGIAWLDVVKIAVAVVGPTLALVGAVWMFFLKLRNEREDVARGQRWISICDISKPIGIYRR